MRAGDVVHEANSLDCRTSPTRDSSLSLAGEFYACLRRPGNLQISDHAAAHPFALPDRGVVAAG